MPDVATHHRHVCCFSSIALGSFKHFGPIVGANNRRLKEFEHVGKHGKFQVLHRDLPQGSKLLNQSMSRVGVLSEVRGV